MTGGVCIVRGVVTRVTGNECQDTGTGERQNVTANLKRISCVLLAAALIGGCAGPARTGLTLDAVNKSMGAPKAGQSRVVVLRKKEFAGIFDVGYDVRLNGQSMGDLKTGTFIYADSRAGAEELTLRQAELTRTSHVTFSAAPGRTYFYRVDLNDKGRAIMASTQAGGLVGMFVSSAVSDMKDDRGVFDFIPLDEANARQEMAELRLAD
jgi:hypothetical protein